MYAWEHETWYQAQTDRWNVMTTQGWEFRRAPPLLNRVGIDMTHPTKQGILVYAAKSLSPEKIHTFMLEVCELYAGSAAQRCD